MNTTRIILIGAILLGALFADAADSTVILSTDYDQVAINAEAPWITTERWRYDELKSTGTLPTRPAKEMVEVPGVNYEDPNLR